MARHYLINGNSDGDVLGTSLGTRLGDWDILSDDEIEGATLGTLDLDGTDELLGESLGLELGLCDILPGGSRGGAPLRPCGLAGPDDGDGWESSLGIPM